DLPQHRRRPRPQPDAARHEECLPAEQARQGAVHEPAGLLQRRDRPGVQAAEEPVRAEAVAAVVVQGARRRAEGRRLEEEPGRPGAELQGRQGWYGLLGAGLRGRPAGRQQQHGHVEGAEGAAGGRLFELREISPVEKYLGLEIVRDRLARNLWLHQQGYADKLRRRFIDEEQTGRTPKTPVSVDAYAELTFDDEEAQERQEEEYRQKVDSL
ncbi:unnamed protein product, partial [Closterium sp. Naga37s-1]